MTIPKFWPKPIPKLFFRYQIVRNRYLDFFPIPNFQKPIPRLFFRYQIFRNRNQDFFSDTKFSETLKKLAKVSKPRSFETEMSISDVQMQWCSETLTLKLGLLSSTPLWVFTQFVDKRIPSTHFVWWSDTPVLRLKQQLKFSLVPCVHTTILHTCCIAGQQQHSWCPWIQCSTYVVLRKVR